MTEIAESQGDGTANVLWFLPTHGDGRYLGTSLGAREVSLRYLAQIAQAADELGYFGDPETVAARMREYIDAGIDTFILSGYPHLEEAHRVAELVLPRLPLAATTLTPRAPRRPTADLSAKSSATPSRPIIAAPAPHERRAAR